jgi:MFS transporter, DHA3 family, multidrug efflux protein
VLHISESEIRGVKDDPSEEAPLKIFYQLLVNTIVANITDMTVWFAVVFFVYLETRSVIAISITNGFYFAATALSGIWFGSLLDRYRKKGVMLVSGCVSLVIYATGFALYMAVPAEAFRDPLSVTLWIFVPLLTIGVIAGNVRGIALSTIITILIPEGGRDKANGLAETAIGLAILIVSAISGFLVGLAGMFWVFILAIVLTVIAILHLATLSIPEGKATAHTAGEEPARLDIRGTLTAISAIPGLFALIFFTTINNFLGGVFAALIDAYGLSLVSVEVWGVLWVILSGGFIVGGLVIARWGLGTNPLRSLFLANISIWIISSVFMIQPSIVLLMSGMFLYLCLVPFIEAAEQTIIQKVIPQERQGRVFGFAQSVEMAATPLTAFFIGPIAELIFIPFMTTGAGVDLIGGWFGTGADRGLALLFTLTGIIGLIVTLIAMNTKYYRLLSHRYMTE